MNTSVQLANSGKLHTALILIGIYAALFCVFLFFSLPNFSQARRAVVLGFAHWDYAHRGLWDMNEGVPENSMEAFRRAVEAGYGIELDVHLTRDGKLVVFHDNSLERMCGVKGSIEDRTLSQLRDLRLAGTEYGIPLFKDVLEMVDGAVPILVELKTPTLDASLCPVVKRRLDTYEGRYIIESFNPYVLRWFRRHAPEVMRGQLATRHVKNSGVNLFARAASTALVVNILGRPDFVAYDYKQSHGMGIRIHRHIYHTPSFAWTVRSLEAYEKVRQSWHSTIFEGFRPPVPPPGNNKGSEMAFPDE